MKKRAFCAQLENTMLVAAEPYQFSIGILHIQNDIPCENQSGFASPRMSSVFGSG